MTTAAVFYVFEKIASLLAAVACDMFEEMTKVVVCGAFENIVYTVCIVSVVFTKIALFVAVQCVMYWQQAAVDFCPQFAAFGKTRKLLGHKILQMIYFQFAHITQKL